MLPGSSVPKVLLRLDPTCGTRRSGYGERLDIHGAAQRLGVNFFLCIPHVNSRHLTSKTKPAMAVSTSSTTSEPSNKGTGHYDEKPVVDDNAFEHAVCYKSMSSSIDGGLLTQQQKSKHHDPQWTGEGVDTSDVDPKKTLLKMDLRLIPMLALLYLLSFLDRR